MTLRPALSSRVRPHDRRAAGGAGGALVLALLLALSTACRTTHVPIVEPETYPPAEEISATGAVPDARPPGASRRAEDALPGNTSGIVLLRPATPPIDLEGPEGERRASGDDSSEEADSEAEALLIREPWQNPVARGGVQAADVGLRFESVRFGFDSSALDFAARQRLIGYCKWLEENAEVHMTLEGHCDERGSSDYNYNLGMTRAWAVKDMMIGQGIEPERIFTISYGEEQPIASGHSPQAHAINRRVEFRPFYPTRNGQFLSSLKEGPRSVEPDGAAEIPPAQPSLNLDEHDAAWPPLTE